MHTIVNASNPEFRMDLGKDLVEKTVFGRSMKDSR